MSGDAPGWSALQGLTGWLWIAAILGFAAALIGPPVSRLTGPRRPAVGEHRAAVAATRPQPMRCCGATCCTTGHRRGCLAHRPVERADPGEVPSDWSSCLVGPQVEGEAHRLPVTLAEQRLDVLLERHG